jgi:HK97 gp10 family phage protein
MAKMTIGKGVDDFISELGDLKHAAGRFSGRALYVGAKIMADALKAQVEALPVRNQGHRERGRRNPTQVEKDGLIEGLGITRKRIENGNSNISIGFDGYNAHVTDKWPKGKPNAMIARSINKGTSFMRRIPFKTQAVNASRAAAEEAMVEEVDKQIKQIMK